MSWSKLGFLSVCQVFHMVYDLTVEVSTEHAASTCPNNVTTGLSRRDFIQWYISNFEINNSLL